MTHRRVGPVVDLVMDDNLCGKCRTRCFAHGEFGDEFVKWMGGQMATPMERTAYAVTVSVITELEKYMEQEGIYFAEVDAGPDI